MSKETVELQRRSIEAFNARNLDAHHRALSVEWNSTFAAVGGAV